MKNDNLFIRLASLCAAFFVSYGYLNASSYRKIETEHYNLIYPDNIEEEAQKVANTLEYIYPHVGASLKHKHEKIDYILDNDTIISNGSTSHSGVVLYTFPTLDPYFSGGLDWLTFLLIHETRHVVQHEREFNFISKLAYIFGGATALHNWKILFTSIPNWLSEGDAVCTETALTRYGRGSMPSYLMNTKALFLENYEKIDYHLAFYRSKVLQIPGCYQLGLLMTRHLRKQYGENAINDIYRRLNSLGYPFFYSVIKKVTNKGLGDLYEEVKQHMRADWQQQVENLKITDSKKLSLRSNKKFMNYYFPQDFDEDHIVVLKTDRKERDAGVEFTLINKNTNKETLLTQQAGLYNIHVKFSAQKNAIAWLEKRNDVLSGELTKTAVMVYDKDVKGYKKKTVVKGRFGFVALSNDKKKVAVFESSPSYNHSLQIFEVETGKLIKKFDNPYNKIYQSFSWSKNDETIFAVSVYDDSMAMESIDVATGNSKYLINPSHYVLANPYHSGDYIYYASSCSGIDNIYAINIQNNKIYQVTSKKYGAFSPSISVDGKKIYFANFTIDGVDAEEMTLNYNDWTPIENIQDSNINFEKVLRSQENRLILQKDIPQKTYRSSNYNILKEHFGSFSWLVNPDIGISGDNAGKFALKFKLIGSNLLKSIESIIAYQYEIRDKVHDVSAKLKFNQIYPQITFGYAGKFSKEQSDFKFHSFNTNISAPLYTNIDYLNVRLQPNISLSFQRKSELLNNDFQSVSSTTEVTPELEGAFSSKTLGDYTISPKKFAFKIAYCFGAKEAIYSKEKLSKKLGQLVHDHKIGSSLDFSYPISSILGVLSIKNVFQTKFDSKVEKVSDNVESFYENRNFDFVATLKCQPYDFYKGDLLSTKVSVNMPILHPDISIPYLAFLSRISVNIFAEHTYLPQTEQVLDGKLVKNIMVYGATLESRLAILSINPVDVNSSELDYALILRLLFNYNPTSYDPLSTYTDKNGVNRFLDDRLKIYYYISFSAEGKTQQIYPLDDKEVYARKQKCRPGYQARKVLV